MFMSISQLYDTDEIISFTPQYSAVIRTILFYNCLAQLQYTCILQDIKNEVRDTPMLQLLWYKIWFLCIRLCKATKLSENQVPERTSTTPISLSTSQAVDHLQGTPVIKACHALHKGPHTQETGRGAIWARQGHFHCQQIVGVRAGNLTALAAGAESGLTMSWLGYSAW